MESTAWDTSGKGAGKLPTTMVITVDVEADNEWQYTTATPGYRGITALPRLQELCDAYGVQPTYLVTFDVASDAESMALLRELADHDRCEIGAHMHPWRTPPLYPKLDCDTGFRPYLYDYPEAIQSQKMASLTHRLEDVFQRKITSYRAGRWGIDSYGCDLLEKHGYVVDTSVAPLRNHRAQLGYPEGAAGPNFAKAPSVPYHPSSSDMTIPGARDLLEIPLSTGIIGMGLGRVWYRKLTSDSIKATGFRETVMRVLRRLRVSRLVALDPVRHANWELMALLAHLEADNATVLNMAFHSSELVAGASPTVGTEKEMRRVWYRIEAVLRTVTSSHAAWSPGLTTTAVAFVQGERTMRASHLGSRASVCFAQRQEHAE